jgi:hypothetical protein
MDGTPFVCARHVRWAGGLKETLVAQPAGRQPVGKGAISNDGVWRKPKGEYGT